MSSFNYNGFFMGGFKNRDASTAVAAKYIARWYSEVIGILEIGFRGNKY